MSEERKRIIGAGGASWLLVASMAVNLFLVGLLAGPLLSGRGPWERDSGAFRPPPKPGFVFERLAKDLPPEEGTKLRAIFEEERQTLHGKRGAMHDAMHQLAEILRAEQPDLNALRQTLEQIEQMGKGLHSGMSRAFERAATELSPETRRKIAEKIESFPRHDPPAPPPPPEDGPDEPPAP